MRDYMLKSLIVFCAIVGLLACPILSRASISIMPSYVQFTLDDGRYIGEFNIQNLGDTEERYRISCIAFRYSETGVMVDANNDDKSMAPWIIFNPKEFSIPPKKTRKIRYIVQPKGALRPGDYWAAMQLESLNVVTRQAKGQEREVNLQFLSAIVVPMFGTSGKPSYNASIISPLQVATDNNDVSMQFSMQSKGTGVLNVNVFYDIINAAGKSVANGRLKGGRLLPDSKRIFRSSVTINQLPQGEYTIKITCRTPETPQLYTTDAKFSWKPPVEQKKQ